MLSASEGSTARGTEQDSANGDDLSVYVLPIAPQAVLAEPIGHPALR